MRSPVPTATATQSAPISVCAPCVRAMSALQSQKTLLLLDEIEDIFGTSPLPFSGKSKTQKGWINRMLEENSLPCFWLSNDIECLDNAYIRRFDVVIELPNPPKSQREQIRSESAGATV